MGRPGWTILLWGALNAGLAAILWAVFEEVDYLSVLMPAAVVAALAALALLGQWSARREERRWFLPDAQPDTSWSAVLLAVAASLALLGLEVGTWLCFIGGGLAALGLGGLVREWRAERRAGG